MKTGQWREQQVNRRWEAGHNGGCKNQRAEPNEVNLTPLWNANNEPKTTGCRKRSLWRTMGAEDGLLLNTLPTPSLVSLRRLANANGNWVSLVALTLTAYSL